MRRMFFLLILSVLLISTPATWAATGGPDDFGYVWDSGAVFAWADATDGVRVPIEDDELAGPFPIGFDFHFYGDTFDMIYVSANGRVAFVEQPETFTIPCIPSDDPYLGYIALYWDDLDPENGGDVYVKLLGEAPNQILIIQYEQVLHWSSTDDRVTAQIVLFEQTGNILLQYEDPSTEAGGGATVGIMSPDGSTGLSILCNQAYLIASEAILIEHPPYVDLRVDDAFAAAPGGHTAQYEVRVRNVTGAASVFSIAFDGNEWATTSDPFALNLDPGATETISVEVEVPATVSMWSEDTVEVTVVSMVNPELQDTAMLTTTAGQDWTLLSNITPMPVQEAAVVTDSQWIYVFSNYLAPGILGSLTRFNLDGVMEVLDELAPAVSTTDGAYLWDKLVFPGGVDENGLITDRLSVYDISDGEWLQGFAMPEPIAFAAVVVRNDKLFVIGGFDGEQALDTMWRFSPEPATWQKMPPMNHPRIKPAVGIVNDQILVAGGSDPTYLDSVEIFDPSTQSWTELNPLPEVMYGMADCTCNGTLFLIGGQMDDHGQSTVYGYDLETDSWFPISQLQLGRFSTEADLLDGKIVVAGGMSELFFPTDGAEYIDLGCADEINVIDRDFGELPDDDVTDDDIDDDSDDDHVDADDDDDGKGSACGC